MSLICKIYYFLIFQFFNQIKRSRNIIIQLANKSFNSKFRYALETFIELKVHDTLYLFYQVN